MQRKSYPEIPDDFGNWLAGFIDGEGCFLITRDRRNWRRDYFQVHFRLCLRSDDHAILRECRERTGIGVLHGDDDPGSDGHDRKPQVRWWTYTRGDTERLVELLTRYPLRAKKRRDFAIWAEAVRLRSAVTFHRGGNPRNGGTYATANDHIWKQMSVLRDQIMEVRKWRDHDSVLVSEPLDHDAVPSGCDLFGIQERMDL